MSCVCSGRSAQRTAGVFAALSARERQVLALMGEGLSNTGHRDATEDQREDGPQSRVERLRQARRVVPHAGDRVCAGSGIHGQHAKGTLLPDFPGLENRGASLSDPRDYDSAARRKRSTAAAASPLTGGVGCVLRAAGRAHGPGVTLRRRGGLRRRASAGCVDGAGFGEETRGSPKTWTSRRGCVRGSHGLSN